MYRSLSHSSMRASPKVAQVCGFEKNGSAAQTRNEQAAKSPTSNASSPTLFGIFDNFLNSLFNDDLTFH